MFCFGAEACVCQLRFCLLLKPEGFVLAVLLSWQRLHRPRMRCGSLGSKPASTSSMRSIGQWSAMVLGAPHRHGASASVRPVAGTDAPRVPCQHARVRGDALSTCMDCGLVSGACLWLSYIRRTVSRRRPGVGNRRWSIPCTSIPHHHVSAGLACLPLLVYAHSDVEWAERVRYAVRTGRDITQGVRRIHRWI